jgi:hypothetical protein
MVDQDVKGLAATDRLNDLRDEQAKASLPAVKMLNGMAKVVRVSASSRRPHMVLDGIDARQTRDLDDRFGANLVMKVGDNHVAVVRLSEDPERAAAAASLLRARYPSGPDEGTPPSEHAGARTVELVSARAEDFLPALPRGKDTALPATDDSPAATIERFLHLSTHRRWTPVTTHIRGISSRSGRDLGLTVVNRASSRWSRVRTVLAPGSSLPRRRSSTTSSRMI